MKIKEFFWKTFLITLGKIIIKIIRPIIGTKIWRSVNYLKFVEK